MATVKDTVLRMMTEYPSLFPTKSDCYNHLFIVIGNGYDWVDGELVDDSNYVDNTFKLEEDEDEVVKEEADRYAKMGLPEDRLQAVIDRARLDFRLNKMRIQFALDNIDLIMQDNVFFQKPYPYSTNYSRVNNYPDDIKADWKEAIDETWSALRTYHASQTKRDDTASMDALAADLHTVFAAQDQAMAKMIEKLDIK